jgi:hypothetical protein
MGSILSSHQEDFIYVDILFNGLDNALEFSKRFRNNDFPNFQLISDFGIETNHSIVLLVRHKDFKIFHLQFRNEINGFTISQIIKKT